MGFKFNAILNFNATRATRQMKTAGRGFQRMSKSIKQMGKSLGKMNQGMRGLALASAPATAGVGFALKAFADFEFQMKTTQSVLLATNEEMKDLSDQAKLMGATTEFSAIQASQGQEALARSGLNSKEIMGALPGVMAAASAAQVDLGEATRIVVGQLGAFGLEAKDAGRVSDAMALTTALTNTNFIELGEAMKFAAPELRSLGISVEETAFSIGVLANAGIRGSLAGTAMKNAMVKLSKPSKKVLEIFGGGEEGLRKFNAQILDSTGKVRPMEVVMANLTRAVRASKNPLEAAGKASEIFGIRGKAAQNAFAAALGKNVTVNEKNIKRLKTGLIKAELGKDVEITTKNFESLLAKAKTAAGGIEIALGKPIPKLVALRLQIAGATGVAQEMRDIKLDTLTGQVILLKSAFEGINIEVGEVFAGVSRGLVDKATQFLSVLTVGFQAAKNGGKATEAQMKALKDNGFKDILPVMIEFAEGFIEGFREIVVVGKEVFAQVSGFMKDFFGENTITAKEIGKLVAKIITIGAIAAPILAGLAAFFFVLGPIIAGVSGAIGFLVSTISFLWGVATFVFGVISTIITFLLSPIGLIILAVTAVGIVIAGIVEKWDEVKAAFADGEFLKGLKLIGAGIMKFLNRPIDLVKQKWQGIKSFFGFGGKDTDDPAGKAAKGLGVSDNLGGIKDAARIQTESVKQKALVQPPSAEKISQAVAGSPESALKAGAFANVGQDINVTVGFRSDAKKVLTQTVTKGAIENAQQQGKTVRDKRRKSQNGFALQ